MAEKSKKKEKNFLVQGSILAIAAIITKIIGVVYRVPLVNILGDKGMGYYNVANEIYVVALTLTSYSLPLAVSKLVSERVARGEYRNSYKVFRGALAFAITAGGSVGLLIFLGAGFIASDLSAMGMSVYALRVLAPCILIVALLGVMRGFFQGNGSMVPTAVSQVIEQIINAVMSIVGAYFLFKLGTGVAKDSKSYGAAYGAAGGTVGTVSGALAALLFLALIFSAYQRILKRQMRRDRTRRRESYRRIFKLLLITIAPIILSATVYNMFGVVDNSMFGKIMAAQGHKQSEYATLLGILGGKYNTLMNVPTAISSALAASLIPSLVATVQNGNRTQIHTKINAVVRFNMMIAIPCAVGFLVLAKPILDLLFFTGNNDTAALMLQMGALSVVFFCLSTVTTAVLQGLDDMMTPVKSAAIAMVIHVAALFLMMVVFKWGIYAVIISRIIFAAATCIINDMALKKKIGYVQEIRRTYVIPTIASAVMGALCLGVHLLFELFIGELAATLAALLVALISYGLLIVLLGGITEEEMLGFPKGTALVGLCKKIHLLRG